MWFLTRMLVRYVQPSIAADLSQSGEQVLVLANLCGSTRRVYDSYYLAKALTITPIAIAPANTSCCLASSGSGFHN